VVTVRKQDGAPTSALSLTFPASRQDAPKQGALEFTRYGNAYFLAKIWTAESRDGLAITRSSREKELARAANPVYSASVPVRRD
jgi:hypothetical protein